MTRKCHNIHMRKWWIKGRWIWLLPASPQLTYPVLPGPLLTVSLRKQRCAWSRKEPWAESKPATVAMPTSQIGFLRTWFSLGVQLHFIHYTLSSSSLFGLFFPVWYVFLSHYHKIMVHRSGQHHLKVHGVYKSCSAISTLLVQASSCGLSQTHCAVLPPEGTFPQIGSSD